MKYSESTALEILKDYERTIKFDSISKELVLRLGGKGRDARGEISIVGKCLEALEGSIDYDGDGSYTLDNATDIAHKLKSSGINFKGSADLPSKEKTL